MALTVKRLRSAAKEMNEVMDLNPPIDVSASESDLKTEVLESIKFIDPNVDTFSEESQSVFDELNGVEDASESEEDDAPEPKEERKTPSGRKEIPIPTRKTAPEKKGKESATKEKPTTKKDPTGKGKARFTHEGSMAEFYDSITREGGTWEELAKLCVEEGKRKGLPKKMTAGVLRAHINFRLKKNPDYFGKMKITKEGVE